MILIINALLAAMLLLGSNRMNAQNNQPSETIFYPTQAYIAEVQQVWQEFLRKQDWQELVKGVTPKQSNCGIIYELPNYLQRPNEDFAIADMRSIKFAEPHYHPDPVVEIYFILQGNALVVVGGQEIKAQSGSVVVTFYRQAHFVIPDKECVMAVVNTPPFDEDHYKVVTETNSEVGFDKKQFKRLTQQR